jgi:epoxyqueuosine reductase QueG
VSAGAALEALARAGLSLHGVLAIADYDSLVPEPWRSAALAPGARSAIVVGNAGRALWDEFVAAPELALEADPLDSYTRRVLEEAARLSSPPARVGFYPDQRQGQYLPLVKLAQRAGFGTPGRVGVLIHPSYGPWIAIRAVLLVHESLAPAQPEVFDPCTGCPAPCATACHGQVIGARGVDVAGCYRTRLTNPACALACDARSACVVGREHAYSRAQIAHHSKIRR